MSKKSWFTPAPAHQKAPETTAVGEESDIQEAPTCCGQSHFHTSVTDCAKPERVVGGKQGQQLYSGGVKRKLRPRITAIQSSCKRNDNEFWTYVNILFIFVISHTPFFQLYLCICLSVFQTYLVNNYKFTKDTVLFAISFVRISHKLAPVAGDFWISQ